MSERNKQTLTAEEMVQAEERFCAPPYSQIPVGYAKDLGLPDKPSFTHDPKKIAIVDKRIHQACQRASRRNTNGNK